MDYLFAPLCLGCWMLPLLIIGVIYAIVRASVNAAQTRGIDSDGIYCAKCRFDLRGNAGFACPECGDDVNRPVGPGYPRGGIIVKGLHPPMSRAMAAVLFVIGGFAPAVIAVIVVGMMLPINYETHVSVDVSMNRPGTHQVPQQLDVRFSGVQERSWTGEGDLLSLDLYTYNPYEYVRLVPLSKDESAKQVAADCWARWSDDPAWSIPPEHKEALGKEFVLLCQRFAQGDFESAGAKTPSFIVEYDEYKYSAFHPIYTLFCFLCVIAAIGLLIWLAVREVSKLEKQFAEKVSGLSERFKALVQSNQARMRGE